MPLLGKRRGNLPSHDDRDVEQPDAPLGETATITIRVKTAGDGREYRVSTSTMAGIAEAS